MTGRDGAPLRTAPTTASRPDTATGWFHRAGRAGPARPPDTPHDRVVAYYLHTWKDFRGVWMDRDNRALHFGWSEGPYHHRRALVRANEVLLDDAARVRSGERLLDAGCGVGGTAMWAARHRGASVVGVTLVADQARRFARYRSERGLTGRAEPITGDYAALPLASATVDVVYAQEALCHAPDKERLLAELWRVLRPGGRLAAMEYVRRDAHAPSSAYRSWLDNWSMPVLFGAGDLRAWLARHTATWAVTDVSHRMEASLRRLRTMARATFVPQAVLHRLGLRSPVQLANLRGALDQWHAYQAGDWFFGLVTAIKPPVGTPAGRPGDEVTAGETGVAHDDAAT